MSQVVYIQGFITQLTARCYLGTGPFLFSELLTMSYEYAAGEIHEIKLLLLNAGVITGGCS